MVATKNKKLYVTNYMQEFQCIGQACGEDHCCQEWKIVIDHENYRKLKSAMEKTPEDRELLKQRTKRNRTGTKSEKSFASFNHNPATKNCLFLDQQGLCEIHGRFGEDYLCNTCRTYPRKINLFSDRVELSALLSCKEIGRLCLLQDDSSKLQAAQWNEFSIDGLDPANEPSKLKGPYASYVHDVREILCDFLSLNDFPLASRLFFICYLANRTANFFRRGEQFDEQQLAGEIDRIATAAMVNELHSGYQSLQADLQIPLQLVAALLSSRGEKGLPPRLFEGVVCTYGLAGQISAPSAASTKLEVSAEVDTILRTYVERQQKLLEVVGRRFQFILGNFCKNHIISNPYTNNKDLLLSMQELLARVTILCFLLISDPRLDPLLDGSSNAEKILDDTAVDVTYKFSRTLEHNQGVWERVFNNTDNNNLTTLAVLSQLLKFIGGR